MIIFLSSFSGPPETCDIRERWLYKILASSRTLIESSTALSEAIIRTHADNLFMIFITDSTRQMGVGVLKSLGVILSKDILSDITMVSSHNSRESSLSSSPVIKGELHSHIPTVLISNCPVLTGHVHFRERLIQYFILLIGACWSCELTTGTVDQLFDIPTNTIEKEGKEHLSTFLSFIPAILTDKFFLKSPSTLPLFTPHVNSIGMSGKNISRDIAVNEISYHIIYLLRTLSNIPTWSIAMTSVIIKILSESSIVLHSSQSMTPLSHLETLGVSVLLGESVGGAYLGSYSVCYHGINKCQILSINHASNTAIILSSNNDQNNRQISSVRICDLTGFPLQFTMKLTKSVVSHIVNYLSLLTGYVEVAISDLLCLFQPEDTFRRHQILRVLRPVELFLFHQLLRALVRSENDMSNTCNLLRNDDKLFQFIIHSCARITSFQPISNYSLNDITQLENQIPKFWTNSSRFITVLPKKTIKTVFPDLDNETMSKEIFEKFMGATHEKHEKMNEKLFKKGMLSELIILNTCQSNIVKDNIEKNKDIDIDNHHNYINKKNTSTDDNNKSDDCNNNDNNNNNNKNKNNNDNKNNNNDNNNDNNNNNNNNKISVAESIQHSENYFKDRNNDIMTTDWSSLSSGNHGYGTNIGTSTLFGSTNRSSSHFLTTMGFKNSDDQLTINETLQYFLL